MSANQPNFLVICTDQMRADHMGCAGNSVIQTPNLDQLAARGVRFDRAYVNCPLCMPSRSTLFTGLTPRGHRVRTNGISLDRSFPTMPQALADAGYQTGSFGKMHLTTFGARRDFAPDGLPPDDYPEQYALWLDGQLTDVPTPQFGFNDVDLVIGHGRWCVGHYQRWLQQEHPEEWETLQKAELVPSPLGAEECSTYPIDEAYHHTRYVADRTIERVTGRDRSNPFFYVCSFPDPHHPYVVPQPWDRLYNPEDVVDPASREGEFDTLPPHMKFIYENQLQTSGRNKPTKMPIEHRREILAYTYGSVSLIDMHVGRMLAALQQEGIADNTIVVFISDHGDLMGDHQLMNKGPFHFEGMLRVPMIWYCPSLLKNGNSSALVSLLDFAPTVLDFAGVDIPEGPTSNEAPNQPPAWPGRSLRPVLEGTRATVQDSVVIENDEDYLGLRLRTLVTNTHKITTYTGHRGPEPYGELFDLANDPHELNNLWDDSTSQPLKRDLIVALHHRLVETDIATPRRLGHA